MTFSLWSPFLGLACAAALMGAAAECRAATPLTVSSAIEAGKVPQTDPRKFAEGLDRYKAGDYAAAFQIWLPLAQNGDISAMRNVGHLLRRGLGTKRDPERALYFYERAGSAGQSGSALNAAFMYLNGDGIPKKPESAAFWFFVAARLGLPQAQYNLGVLYETGTGVEKFLPVALGWYGLAAQGGNTIALERLKRLVPTLPAPPAPASVTKEGGGPNLPPPAPPGTPEIERTGIESR